jgi:CYTH domain-containing protein
MTDTSGVSKEIEHKYLLKDTADLEFPADRVKAFTVHHGWIPGLIIQERITRKSPRDKARSCCYDSHEDDGTIFLRAIKAGKGLERIEAQEKIDSELWEQLWRTTTKKIRKIRYEVREGDLTWEVDMFSFIKDRSRKLSLAEVEVPTVDTKIVFPDWLAPFIEREVTDDPAYLNINLAE